VNAGSTASFLVARSSEDGVAILQPRGELDMATGPTLYDVICAVEKEANGDIVLDLARVSFIDASGIHAIARAHRTCVYNGKRLVVRGAAPFARKVFTLTGTDHILGADG
jgi:anti-anti-sigma factor